MRHFNWTDLADRCSLCPSAAPVDGEEREESWKRRRWRVWWGGGGQEVQSGCRWALIPLLNCSSYLNTRKWITKLLCLNQTPGEEIVTWEMCLRNSAAWSRNTAAELISRSVLCLWEAAEEESVSWLRSFLNIWYVCLGLGKVTSHIEVASVQRLTCCWCENTELCCVNVSETLQTQTSVAQNSHRVRAVFLVFL